MVTTSAPSACTASIRQPRTTRPSTRTEQAPHTPCSQPRCEPVSPRSVRRKSTRCWRTGTVRVTALAVDGERDLQRLLAHAALARSAAVASARRVSTRCRCRRIRLLPCGLVMGERSCSRADAAAAIAPASSMLRPTMAAPRTLRQRGFVLAAEVDEACIRHDVAGRPVRWNATPAMAKSPCRWASSMNTETEAGALHGDQGFDQQLVGPARRLVEALEVVVRRHLAPAGSALQHQGGAERQHAGRHLGRRVGERDAAAEGAAIAHRDVGDMRHGLGDQRQVLARRSREPATSAWRVSAPMRTCSPLQRDAGQRVQPVDVDQQPRLRQAHVERRHQALAAGQDARVLAVPREQLEHLLDAVGAHVAELRRLHAAPCRELLESRCDCRRGCHRRRPAQAVMPLPRCRMQLAFADGWIPGTSPV